MASRTMARSRFAGIASSSTDTSLPKLLARSICQLGRPGRQTRISDLSGRDGEAFE